MLVSYEKACLRRLRDDLIPIISVQVHAQLDYCCNPAHGLLTLQSQAIVSVEIRANIGAKSLEPPSWPIYSQCFHADKSNTENNKGDELVDFAIYLHKSRR